jgi:hypothetical protein
MSGIELSGGQVRELTLAGACQDATILSSGFPADAANADNRAEWFVPYAAYYYIHPQRGGDCSVHVVMRDGSVGDKTVPMRFSEPGSGCCSGNAFAVTGTAEQAWSTFTWAPVDAGIE